MVRKESTGGSASAKAQQEAISEGIENFELPRSLVMKLARASQIPENTKFQKDVILSIMKASTVFINYIAATAHEVASQKQHKSISATDVLKALEMVEFGDIAQNVQGELQIFRELQKADKSKKGGNRNKVKDAESASVKSKGKAKAAPQTIPTIHISRPAAVSARSENMLEPEHAEDNDIESEAERDVDEEMMDAEDDVEDDIDEGGETWRRCGERNGGPDGSRGGGSPKGRQRLGGWCRWRRLSRRHGCW
ncbi:DNA polymerase epsilon subunit D [Grifola frondosa]|uniref:DNA polymerase epsilon subunit D n=1 Tax=Grifola frondosa TaxID=5627 RepID=A0A1C7M7U9_GRIFR|nr:DNA polymerase epsilon subunit D [Grifola frondosa]